MCIAGFQAILSAGKIEMFESVTLWLISLKCNIHKHTLPCTFLSLPKWWMTKPQRILPVWFNDYLLFERWQAHFNWHFHLLIKVINLWPHVIHDWLTHEAFSHSSLIDCSVDEYSIPSSPGPRRSRWCKRRDRMREGSLTTGLIALELVINLHTRRLLVYWSRQPLMDAPYNC